MSKKPIEVVKVTDSAGLLKVLEERIVELPEGDTSSRRPWVIDMRDTQVATGGATTEMTRTRAALAVYDAGRVARDSLWDRVETNDDVWACVATDKAAADLVREAFAADSAHVNRRDRAFLVHPDDPWLRRLVAKFGTPP